MFLDYNLDIEEKSVWKISHPTSEREKYPFIVNECGVFYAKKMFYTKRYAKDDFQILYTVSGAGKMIYEDTEYKLTEGSIVMINCNKYHDYCTAVEASHWTYYWIHIGGSYSARYYQTLYRNGFKPYIIGIDNELITLFNNTSKQIDFTTGIAYILISNSISGILAKIVQFLNFSPQSPQEIIVQKMIDYIKNNYTTEFNIDEAAKYLSISKFYLIRLFSSHVGMTPYQYLIQHRINEAKKLLLTTNHKVNDIAEAVGFSDASNFSRTFTKLIGISPAKYRCMTD